MTETKAAKSPARGLTPASPSTSPRLPSPPPLPELQLGPRSPSVTAPTTDISLDSTAVPDEGAARRIRPGTKAVDMAKGPPFVQLDQLESPFQLQEYLKSFYSKLTRGDMDDEDDGKENEHKTIKPVTKDMAIQLATPPTQQDTGEPVDRNLWLYELCRFLVQRSNRLIVSFFNDSPPCSSQTCPEMRASEWQYLCAVHEPPKSCCAIDYCCHTLDWAANVLTSTKHFPSRLSLGGDGGSAYQSMRQLTNIFRRVYRIYAHAWFQHREVFWSLEQEEGLYRFFKTVCDAYQLIPEDNYTIPAEAEGERMDDTVETPVSSTASGKDITLLRNDTQINIAQRSQESNPLQEQAAPENVTQTTGATTRRHRHTPSTGTQVTMIAEGPEEEDNDENTPSTNLSYISQIIPAETTATTSRAEKTESLEPPSEGKIKAGRENSPSQIALPKPEFTEAQSVPEDPTPTPEQHGTDPFGDDRSVTTTSSEVSTATEASTDASSAPSVVEHSEPKEATAESKEDPKSEEEPEEETTMILDEPPTPATATRTEASIPLPALDTRAEKAPSSPPKQTDYLTDPGTTLERRRTSDASGNDTVHSPGGGSIRTIGPDILSGILAHDSEDDDEQMGEIKLGSGTLGAGDDIAVGEASPERKKEAEVQKEEAAT